MTPRVWVLSVACLLGYVASLPAAELTADRSADKVVVKIDGKPFAEYLTQCGPKPIVWPIYGPTGDRMTREYPMAADPPLKNPSKKKPDHPHHRSLWFTHGKVNDISFWEESPKAGTIKHREFVEVRGGPTARIVTRNDWIDTTGKRQLEDLRTLAFGGDKDRRWIDFDIQFIASDGPVTFGDTKEGAFGVRVAESVKVDANEGGKIVNSEGKIDKDAWAQRAAWVDYHGPINGQTLGIAVMNHPSSFRYPTYWHVRTYGLFAANPFGVKDFTAGKQPEGAYTVEKGKSITLRYRVLLHAGDEKQGHVAEAFKEYAK